MKSFEIFFGIFTLASLMIGFGMVTFPTSEMKKKKWTIYSLLIGLVLAVVGIIGSIYTIPKSVHPLLMFAPLILFSLGAAWGILLIEFGPKKK